MNLHAHTFHSFNSCGWSPSRLVYEALREGLEMIGTVDFDVMDAVLEVLEAGDTLGIKTVAGLESRVYIPEYATQVINSPGEPGIAYFMLTGCYQLPVPGTPAAATLASLKEIAQSRNQEMIAKVNPFLSPVVVDYESDLLPMTPSGNPTERHLVEAYDRKAREHFEGDDAGLVCYWSDKFGLAEEKVAALIPQTIAFQETLRSKVMKRGGAGYITPDPARFPTLDAMIDLGRATGALPTVAWLDGSTEGEADIRGLLAFFVSKGIAALNIIPDRNWNLKEPAEKALKVAKLAEVVAAAAEFDLPLCIGTEMNKAGQPLVDDFSALDLQPFVEAFRKGARTLWGHTMLARTLDFGWLSGMADAHFGDSRRKRLDFYRSAGERFGPGRGQREAVSSLPCDPATILKA
jgi:hypothetical protein